MPIAKPRQMRIPYIVGSASGNARTRKAAALPSMLVKVSGVRPMAKISRA
jgi:hypothetical protein